MSFDPLAYWEQRHQKATGLSGVGYLGLQGYNEWMYRVRKHVFRRVLRPHRSRLGSARVLDVGSGTGFYLTEWQRHGPLELVGSDFSGVALDRLRKDFSLRIEHLDITTEDPRSLEKLGRFDFISIIDVLFHIVDDTLYDRAFRNLATLLKSDGVLIFTENFLQAAPRGGNAWQSLRLLSEVERSVRQAGLHLEARVPWFMLMNGPVDSQSPLLKKSWATIEKVCHKSRLAGFALGAAMYPAEVLLTKAFKESPTSEIACATRRPRS